MENKRPHTNASEKDEIDLSILFYKSVGLINKYLKLMLIVSVVGICVGFLLYNTSKPVYKGDMVISSKIVGKQNSEVALQLFEKLFESGNYYQLGQMLELPEEEITKVVSLESETLTTSEEVIKSPSMGAREIISSFSKITISSTDSGSLEKFQDALIQHLENNTFVKKRVDQNKAIIKKKIASIDREIADIEVLKSKIKPGKLTVGETEGNIMYELGKLNELTVSFHREKINLESELAFANNYEVLQPYTPDTRNTEGSLVFSISAGGAIGFFLAIMIILAIEGRKYYQRLRKEYES